MLVFDFELHTDDDDYFRGYVAGLYKVSYDVGLRKFYIENKEDFLKGQTDGLGDWNTEYSHRKFQPGDQFPLDGWSEIVKNIKEGDTITRVENDGDRSRDWALDPLLVLKKSLERTGAFPGRATWTGSSWIYEHEPLIVVDMPDQG